MAKTAAPEEADDEQPLVAVEVAGLPQRRSDEPERQHRAGDDPGQRGLVGAEVVGDVDERDRQQRDGDARREEPDQHDHQDEPAMAVADAVDEPLAEQDRPRRDPDLVDAGGLDDLDPPGRAGRMEVPSPLPGVARGHPAMVPAASRTPASAATRETGFRNMPGSWRAPVDRYLPALARDPDRRASPPASPACLRRRPGRRRAARRRHPALPHPPPGPAATAASRPAGRARPTSAGGTLGVRTERTRRWRRRQLPARPLDLHRDRRAHRGAARLPVLAQPRRRRRRRHAPPRRSPRPRSLPPRRPGPCPMARRHPRAPRGGRAPRRS